MLYISKNIYLSYLPHLPFNSPLLITHRIQLVMPTYAWRHGHQQENVKIWVVK